MSITTVTNLVRHGCRDHGPADPPVGPDVNDLAAALAELAPFRVASPPRDVAIYGYPGKHLVLRFPDMPVEVIGDEPSFAQCAGGDLKSWIAPDLSYAFYGYTGPGYTEEFWILNVEGSRLVIAAERSPGSPPRTSPRCVPSSTPYGSSHEVAPYSQPLSRRKLGSTQVAARRPTDGDRSFLWCVSGRRTLRPPVSPFDPGNETTGLGAVGVDAPERTNAGAAVFHSREEDPIAIGRELDDLE